MSLWDTWKTGDVILYRQRGAGANWATRTTHRVIRSVQTKLGYGVKHAIYSHVALYVSHGIVIDSTRNRGVHPSSITLDAKAGFDFVALRPNESAGARWNTTDDWPESIIAYCNEMMGTPYGQLTVGKIGAFAAKAFARNAWSDLVTQARGKLNPPNPAAAAQPGPRIVGDDDALICSELVWGALLAASNGAFCFGDDLRPGTSISLPADFSMCTYFDRVPN